MDELLERGVRPADRRECFKMTGGSLPSALRFAVSASALAVAVRYVDPRDADSVAGRAGRAAVSAEPQTMQSKGADAENGRLIALFGVASDARGHGIVWLAATCEAEAPALAVPLARASRRFVEHWLQHFTCLRNQVDPDNTLSLNWLAWLGFDIDRAHPVRGPLGHELYPFHRVFGAKHGH